MKYSLSSLLLFTILSSCISTSPDTENYLVTEKKMSYEEWLVLAKHDIRLFPMYGHAVKTSKQLEADAEFVERAIADAGSPDSASNYYFKKACTYMKQRDLQTVMYRLNQAWLLNVKNPDVYRGFGWVYLQLEQYDMAIKLFDKGLGIDPDNEYLLSMKTLVVRKVKKGS